jgi:hypothetical protein
VLCNRVSLVDKWDGTNAIAVLAGTCGRIRRQSGMDAPHARPTHPRATRDAPESEEQGGFTAIIASVIISCRQLVLDPISIRPGHQSPGCWDILDKRHECSWAWERRLSSWEPLQRIELN